MATVPGTSIGGAIDWLLATLEPKLRPLASDLVLADGMATLTSNTIVTIGRNGPASGMASDLGQVVWAELGAGRLSEQYLVHNFIQVYRPDQRTARQDAIALYNGVVSALHADPSLGGLLVRGRASLVTQFQLEQTADERDTAGGTLRLACIDFALHVQNAYLPA
jgi:hypothetical protein